MTVAKALAALERDGLVRRLVGRGTFVAGPEPVTSVIDTRRILSFEEQMGLSGHAVGFRLLGFARTAAPSFARERLQVPARTQVYRLDRLRLINQRVIGLEERYIRVELAERILMPALATKGAMEIISDLLGYHVPFLEATLFPAVADQRLASVMEIMAGSPVTVREHVLRDRERRAVLCGVNTFTAEARISYRLGTATLAQGSAKGAFMRHAVRAN